MSDDIYDIGVVRSVLNDIMNVFGKNYIVSGPVWEYFENKDDLQDTRWSDGYMPDYEPTISSVLRCPVCKKYHFYDHSQIVCRCRTFRRFDRGYLSYEHLKEALAELAPKGEKEEELRMMLLWAYNDKYGQMHNVKVLPAKLGAERKFFRENAIALFRLRPNDYLLHAELFRELGEFENCLAVLDGIGGNKQPKLFNTLREKAQNKDSNVFIVELDKFSETERHPIKDDKGYIYSSRKDWNWEYIKECFNDIVERIRIKFGWYDEDELW
jgi:hypothetical protein